MASKKYYVVWKGKKTGIFDSWDEVKRLIQGVSGAKYKSFNSMNEAKFAYQNPDKITSAPRKKKNRYYVIWDGDNSAIYTDWDVAQQKLKGLSKDQLKTFGSKILAEKALLDGPEAYKGIDFRKTKDLSKEEIDKIGQPIELSLSVDAACNEMTGIMEYQGVWVYDRQAPLFKMGPYQGGSNNIGEFLALVHALALFEKNKDSKFKHIPIYSDSRIAMNWIHQGKCKTKIQPSSEVLTIIRRAEKWLASHEITNPILKWETKVWGEIPADFGRK